MKKSIESLREEIKFVAMEKQLFGYQDDLKKPHFLDKMDCQGSEGENEIIDVLFGNSFTMLMLSIENVTEDKKIVDRWNQTFEHLQISL